MRSATPKATFESTACRRGESRSAPAWRPFSTKRTRTWTSARETSRASSCSSPTRPPMRLLHVGPRPTAERREHLACAARDFVVPHLLGQAQCRDGHQRIARIARKERLRGGGGDRRVRGELNQRSRCGDDGIGAGAPKTPGKLFGPNAVRAGDRKGGEFVP